LIIQHYLAINKELQGRFREISPENGVILKAFSFGFPVIISNQRALLGIPGDAALVL